MWDLSSPTRDRTMSPAVEGQSLNHWTTKDVLKPKKESKMTEQLVEQITSSN